MPTLLKISLLAAVLLQMSCVTTDYIGKTYSPTTQVDLYFDKADIGRPFETMGSIQLKASDLMTFQQVKRGLLKEAKSRGADAVLIDGMDTLIAGSPANLYGTGSGAEDPHYYSSMYDKLKDTGTHSDLPASPYPSDVQYKMVTGKLLKYR